MPPDHKRPSSLTLPTQTSLASRKHDIDKTQKSPVARATGLLLFRGSTSAECRGFQRQSLPPVRFRQYNVCGRCDVWIAIMQVLCMPYNEEIVCFGKVFTRPNVPPSRIAFGRMTQAVDRDVLRVKISTNSNFQELVAREKVRAELSADAPLRVS